MPDNQSTKESAKNKDPIQDAWKERTDAWEQLAQAQGFVTPEQLKSGQFGHIDPSKVKMEVGPPMTEEQFKAWMDRRKKIVKNFSQS